LYKNSHTRKVLNIISDKFIIAILKQLRKRDSYANDIADNIDMAKSTVWNGLKKLENLGLVESYYTTKMGRRVKMYKFKEYQFPFTTLSELLESMVGDS